MWISGWYSKWSQSFLGNE